MQILKFFWGKNQASREGEGNEGEKGGFSPRFKNSGEGEGARRKRWKREMKAELCGCEFFLRETLQQEPQ
jgi:hypothetical protein